MSEWSSLVKALPKLPMDEASRLARAKEMGFHADVPLYHGTDKEFRAFDPTKRGDMTGATSARTGEWTTADPVMAEHYAFEAALRSGGAPRIYPLLHRAQKPASLSLSGLESEREVASTLSDAFDRGFDAVMIRVNNGKPMVVVKDPSQLRSPFAAFDPAKKQSRDLLAGVAGGAVAAGAAMAPDSASAKEAQGGQMSDWSGYPFDPYMDDAFAAAARRQRQAVQPHAGGRARGSASDYLDTDAATFLQRLKAAGISAADPFGVPSGVIGQWSPEARDAIRGQYEGEPLAAAIGSMATPAAVARGAVSAVKSAPSLGALLLGAGGAALSADETGARDQSARDRAAEARARANAAKAEADAEIRRMEAGTRTEQERFQQRQHEADAATARAEAERKRKAEMSFREALPGLAPSVVVGAPLVSGALGFLGGRGVRAFRGEGGQKGTAAVMAGAGAGGALEGGLSQYLLTEADASGLPRGSPAQAAATQDLADPSFWASRVAPAAIGSAGSAALGAKYGLGRPRVAPIPPGSVSGPGPAGPPQAGSSVPIPGASGTTPAVPPTGGPSAPLPPSKPWQTPNLEKTHWKDVGGKWHDKGSGRFVIDPWASFQP